MSIKIFVPTCNSYAKLLVPFSYCLNKFWPGQSVVALYYDDIPDLPNNFESISLGCQKSYGKTWTNALYEYFISIKDEYVFLVLDDCFLTDYPDENKIRHLISYTKISVDKIDFKNTVFRHGGNEIDFGVVKADQGANYRTSTEAALWKREYLLKYLKPNRTAWDFELIGSKEAKDDDGIIIGPTSIVLDFKHIYIGGKLSEKALSHYPKPLLEEIGDMIYG